MLALKIKTWGIELQKKIRVSNFQQLDKVQRSCMKEFSFQGLKNCLSEQVVKFNPFGC